MPIGRMTGFPALPDDPNAGELTGRSGTEYGDFVTPNPQQFALPGEETVSFVPDTSEYEGLIERRRDLPSLRPGAPGPQMTPHLEHPRYAAEQEEQSEHINNPLDFIHLDAMEHSPYGGLRESAELGRLLVKVDRERKGYPTNKRDSRFLLRGQYDALKLEVIRGQVPELRSFFNKRPGASMSPRELILIQEWMQLIESNFKPAVISNASEPEEAEPAPTPLNEAVAEVEQEEQESVEARKSTAGNSSLGYHISNYDSPLPDEVPEPPDATDAKLTSPAASSGAPPAESGGSKPVAKDDKDPATLELERQKKKANAATKRPFTPIDQVNVMPIKAGGMSFTPPSLLGKGPQSRGKPWWYSKGGFDPTKDPFIRIDSLRDGSAEKRLAQFILGTSMMGGYGLRGIEGEICSTDMRFFYDEQQHGMNPMMQKTWVNLWQMLDYPDSREVGDPHEEPGMELIDWYRSTHDPSVEAAQLAAEKQRQMVAAQGGFSPRGGTLPPLATKRSGSIFGHFRKPRSKSEQIEDYGPAMRLEEPVKAKV